MIDHARRDSPDECCGLLVGSPAAIDEAIPATNLERGPARFRIDPVEHLALIKRLRGTGRCVAGVYHSHPRTPAVPSASDLREAYYPDYLYVIVSLADAEGPDIQGWRIRDGVATRVRLLTDP